MGLYHLDKIFEPNSIAVIGASETQGSIGQVLMANLTQNGYEGRVIPINPKYSQVAGITAYPSLSEADQAADLAVIATPISTVPGIVRECVDMGVSGAVIISAGGRETGKKGRDLENDIEQEARKGGLRIIGPNCMGFIRPDRNLNASFAGNMPPKGKTAFISQSGAVCSAMLDLSLKENMGFRYFISIGSMLDVDFGDLIDYLGNDPGVTSILLYIESLSEIKKFMSAARQVSRVKPIVVLKSGRSEAGARAAASHTGAMAGEDQVYEAAFERAGLARVRTLVDFFDCAELLAKQSPPSGRNLVVVTNAGGPGVMAADALAEHGLGLSSLSEKTLSALNDILPPHWSHGNPVDILGDATPDRYVRVTDICFEAEEIDGMLVIVNPQAMTNTSDVARALGRDLQGKSFPVFTAIMGGRDVEEARQILNDKGVPTYDTPERAVHAFAVLYDYTRNVKQLQEIPSRLLGEAETDEDQARHLVQEALKGKKEKNGFLSEVESKQLLACYGIPVNPTRAAGSVEEAQRVADEMGYPLVMKILSPDISHKTEANGIRTHLETRQDIWEAYQQVTAGARDYDPNARILGVSLQPMIQDADVELLIGAKQDPNFGPVILFGMGGIFAEVIEDQNIGLPPLNQVLARRLMQETKAHKLLAGYRNIPAAHMDLFEQLLVCLSHLLVDFPEISELDMNPVMVHEGAPITVDARVLLHRTEIRPPHHLIIRPYPEQYESEETTAEGEPIFIRPIKPEDAPMLVNLFESLSSKSRYHRFFSPMKSLSHDLLIRLTQIDYDRHIALAALSRNQEEERMLGVARVIIGPDRDDAEFSVAVGDPWQGKGVGRKLLERVLDAGRDYGVQTVYGIVLAENRHMLNLGRELGFQVSQGEEAGSFHLSIRL